MKYAILLAVHNKVDDLLTHLDIQKHNPYNHTIIIAYSLLDLPIMYLEAIQQHHHIAIDGLNFGNGPPMSLVYGIRKAHELGIDYLAYRNADDWCLNHNWTELNFNRMVVKDKLAAGYNWFSQNSFNEFAMNELYCHVPTFMKSTKWAENLILHGKDNRPCEYKMGAWLNMVIKDQERFMRIEGRENFPGIAHDQNAIRYIYKNILQMKIPEETWLQFAINNRFFNRDWQLIGCHNNRDRYQYWTSLRGNVEYTAKLEREPSFSKWLEACHSKGQWNLHNSEDNFEQRQLNLRPKRTPCRLLARAK